LTQTELTGEAATAAPPEQNAPARATMISGDIPVLNGIRGLLALWVLLGHVHIYCGGQLPFLSTPGMAVYAFMVMSGFLMALHFRLREQREPWQSPKTWGIFYVRRFFRIAPLYYLLLAFALTFQGPYMAAYNNLGKFYRPDFVQAVGIPAFDLDGFDFATLFYHVTFLFGAIPSQSSNNMMPDWSIGLEMQFYLVFPFLMIALRKIGPAWFAACAPFGTSVSAAVFPAPGSDCIRDRHLYVRGLVHERQDDRFRTSGSRDFSGQRSNARQIPGHTARHDLPDQFSRAVRTSEDQAAWQDCPGRSWRPGRTVPG
jgi:peptidoglycan/LPS O-acetylase OafA/YrhL